MATRNRWANGTHSAKKKTSSSSMKARIAAAHNELEQLEQSFDADFHRYIGNAQNHSLPGDEDDMPTDSMMSDESGHALSDTSYPQLSIRVDKNAPADKTRTATTVGSWQTLSMLADEKIDTEALRILDAISDTLSEGIESPGAYFGARSMPIDSVNDVWNRPTEPSEADRVSETSIPEPDSIIEPLDNLSLDHGSVMAKSVIRCSPSPPPCLEEDTTADPLWKHFKSLPTTLGHRRTCLVKRLDTPSLRAAVIRRSKQLTPFITPSPSQSSITPHHCTVEPRLIELACDVYPTQVKVSDAAFTIHNTSESTAHAFSIYCMAGRFMFTPDRASLSPGQSTTINIEARKSVLAAHARMALSSRQVRESVVVIVDDAHLVHVDIDLDIRLHELGSTRTEISVPSALSLHEKGPDATPIPSLESPHQDHPGPACHYCALEEGGT